MKAQNTSDLSSASEDFGLRNNKNTPSYTKSLKETNQVPEFSGNYNVVIILFNYCHLKSKCSPCLVKLLINWIIDSSENIDYDDSDKDELYVPPTLSQKCFNKEGKV